VVRARHEHPGELAVRPGGRLEAERREAADLLQQVGEEPHELQASLRDRLGIERMGLGEPWQAGGPFVHLRVVLHRARPERIEVQVNRLVEVGEPL
jgi:hypothetical protein